MPVRHLNDVPVRLRAVGLHPTVVTQLVQQIQKWETHHGAEWTVKRLKSLKVDFVRMLAGLEPSGDYARKCIRTPDGKLIRIPKGVFGYLFSLGQRSHDRRTLHKVWQALIVHTRYSSECVTWNQWKKFSTAVRKPKPEKSDLRVAQSYVSIGLGTLPKPGRYDLKPEPLMTFQPREGKRIPHGRKTLPESSLLHQFRAILDTNPFPSIVREELIEPVVIGTPWSGRVKEITPDSKIVRPLHHVGSIGFIQEPGYKLRAVANPNRVLQRALDPLGVYAFRWLRSVPQDCCYQQEAGVFAIQGRLKKVTCHSLDLSNATDLFPYELVDMVMAFARVPRSARILLESVSKGSWLIPFSARPISRKNIVLRWNRGIPLGLRPCFALFSLAHHALVRGICVKLGKLNTPQGVKADLRSADYPYRILGDDIVIWDDSVAVEYRRVLRVIGCSISEEKSLSSADVAEFAGRVILPNVILHGLKYGDESHDNSFLEQVKSMGPRTIRTLLPKQREVARFISDAAPPVGFGWNPRGLPFEERLAKAMAWELSAPGNSQNERVVQIRVAMANWYSYKYSDLAEHRYSGSEPRSKAWDPLSIDQMESRPEYLGLPVEVFHGNVEDVLEFQRLNKGLKEERFEALLRGWDLLSKGSSHHDHPYNKPLIQVLYPRLQRARKILPSVRALLLNGEVTPTLDETV
nr:MAG: RNA-dependent RNA polymerase [Mitovirus sp.]